ncbi:MAG TPA: hypothetical protein PKW55_02905 [Spirochaetota bacterium]|mgnify:CR=1 FL=1|nr:hypothetical protein [Spirochaetota bacterium]HOM38201.1 hypothetical protein [Spirochaetota bacterium]HPQ48581.1 hypothetical protein [Spirochaetota bacterium]
MEEKKELKAYTEKLDKVMKYTDNDINRAKQIVQGILKDFLVIKGKINIENQNESGLFILFFHKYKHYLVDKFSAIQTGQKILSTLEIKDSWLLFFKEIDNIISNQEYQKEKVSKINIQFEKEFSPAIISQMIGKIENRDITSVTIQIENIFSYIFGRDAGVFVQIEPEDITSLEYEENVRELIHNRELEKTRIDETIKKVESEESLKDEVTETKNSLINEGNIILNGELSLSPIKGKFISELSVGDIIGVKINDTSQKAINIIKQLNLITEDGKIKKVKGKIIFLKKTEKGYTLLVRIAPLIILEITEEEEVKIECFTQTPTEKTKGKKKQGKDKSNTKLIIISSIISSIIVATIILLLI